MGAPNWPRRDLEKKLVSQLLWYMIFCTESTPKLCICAVLEAAFLKCEHSTFMPIGHVHFFPCSVLQCCCFFAFVSSSRFCFIVFFLRVDRRIRRVFADYFTWWFIDWDFARVFLWTGDDGSSGNAETGDDRAAGVGHAAPLCCLQGT